MEVVPIEFPGNMQIPHIFFCRSYLINVCFETFLMWAYPKTGTSLGWTPWLFPPVLKSSTFYIIKADKITHNEKNKGTLCFLVFSCQWSRSGKCSCTWICFNIHLSIIHFIWYKARYTMRGTDVPPNVTRSTKARDV